MKYYKKKIKPITMKDMIRKAREDNAGMGTAIGGLGGMFGTSLAKKIKKMRRK